MVDLRADTAFDALRDRELMNLAPETLFPVVHSAARQANDDHHFLSSGGLWRDFPSPLDEGAED